MKNEETILNDNIGLRITNARNLKSITKTDLSKIIKVSIQQLDKYEKGTNRISAAKLAILSNYIGVDINYFYCDISSEILDIEKKKERDFISELLSNLKAIKEKEDRDLVFTIVRSLSKKN